MNATTLDDLKPGESATVASVEGENQIARRLMEMGVVPGSRVSLVKSAPFGDPIEIRVRGFNLAIRREEARQILVEATP